MLMLSVGLESGQNEVWSYHVLTTVKLVRAGEEPKQARRQPVRKPCLR